ncbi:MAG: hypothetical protein B7Y99_04295 [Caulobacterales bacterium 32-69-10]|nr:MAG: hypothetical protein B7Y99_04295 [Caulobacterales bacterium 32-69-10]
MLQHQFLSRLRLCLVLAAGLALAGPAHAQGLSLARGCVADGPPQAGLPTEQLAVNTQTGPKRFKVQIAADEATRAKGLMFVRRMADDEGMIFDFKTPQATAFWMHNTYIPLDLLFVQADGRILRIARNAPICSDVSIPSGGPVRTVVEINAGLSDRLGIREGDYVTSTVTYPYR